MHNPGKLGKIVVGMNRALGEIPLTVKLRTGVKDGANNAHKIMPRLAHEWGVGGLAVSFHQGEHCSAASHHLQLHGRSRQQRYAKLADWSYIAECVKAVREAESEDDRKSILQPCA